METIAVYWEPKIRVYGLTTQVGLTMCTLVFPSSRLSFFAGVIGGIEAEGRAFELVNLQAASPGTLQLCLLPAAGEGDVRRLLEEQTAKDHSVSLQVADPVELIYLHGPHFQDRFGIVEAALAPLHGAGIPVLAAGCAGTSVYLVVPLNTANAAKLCLSETFVL